MLGQEHVQYLSELEKQSHGVIPLARPVRSMWLNANSKLFKPVKYILFNKNKINHWAELDQSGP